MSKNGRALPPAALAAMGVVFGDIGTSPLYTLQVAVKAASPAGTISPDALMGIVSLIFWSLVVVLVAVEMSETPRVCDEDRVTVTALSECIARVELKFGFMEPTFNRAFKWL